MTGAAGELKITSEDDILEARRAREAAEAAGFRRTDVTRIVTAASELARNIYLHAESGVMEWEEVTNDGETGLKLVFDDDGPGIPEVEAALKGEYSTSEGMGRGLVGTKELMDEIDIETAPDEGTTVTIIKWNPQVDE